MKRYEVGDTISLKYVDSLKAVSRIITTEILNVANVGEDFYYQVYVDNDTTWISTGRIIEEKSDRRKLKM